MQENSTKRRGLFGGGSKRNVVYPVETDGDEKFKEQAFMRKAMARSHAVMSRNKKRILAVISTALVIFGLGIIAIAIAGAVLIAQSETCKFPRHSLTETFRFVINNDLVTVQAQRGAKDAKPYYYTGPTLDTLEVENGFGSITLQSTYDDAVTDIVVQVFNRASNRGALSDMVYVNTSIIATPQNDTLNTKIYTSVLKITSQSSNSLTGNFRCRRSDVVITLPGKCLLDGSNFKVKVDKGQINVRDSMINTNVKGLTLQNTAGEILIRGAQATRINVNTTEGSIDAQGVIGNVVFLLAIKDGATIKASNITLFAGNDTNCFQRLVYPPGFEGDVKYARNETVCPVRDGKLTLDAQGADLGTEAAVSIGLVTGGSIEGSIKVGHISLLVQACIEFSGTYSMKADFGARKVTVDTSAPIFKELYRQLEDDPDTLSDEVKTLLVQLAQRQYDSFWSPGGTDLLGNTVGTICASQNGTQAINLKSLTTGDLRLTILPPLKGLVEANYLPKPITTDDL